MKLSNVVLAIFILGLVNSYIVVNSQDPSDVSSAVFYANAKGDEVFVVTPGSDLLSSERLIGSHGSVLLIESPSNQILAGLRNGMESNGNSVEVVSLTGTQLNLELARRSGASRFVVTDPVYGYNVVALVAYAKSTGAYLIFANRSSIGEVSNFLAGHRPSSLLLYGTLDEEVVSALNQLGVEAEAIDNGDKYEDNMQILDKYFALNSGTGDVLLADGSALEVSINSGRIPVVLVSDVIPERLYNYMLGKISGGQIRVGTLVGSSQINPVYDMMKRLNNQIGEKKFSVFVKFGQATSSGGEPAPLSMFPLPYPDARVSLASAAYNPSLGAFEIIYSNAGNAPAYVRSTIAVLLDGQQIGTIGDDGQYVIRRGEIKGVRYAFANPGEGQLAINDTTYYGISKYSPDKGFIKYMDVGRISFVDQSSVVLSDASYSPFEDKLTVKVRNNGSTDASYRLTVAYVNDEGLTVYEEEQPRNISSGRNDIVALTGVIQLPQDKADKTTMNATATYGAREAFMDKEASAPVKIEGFPWWILLILLLIILIIAYWYYRKKKKEKEPLEAEAPKKKK